MASSTKALVLLFLVTISLASESLAGRNVPSGDSKWLESRDQSVLIPGIGRVVIPKMGDNPFKYDPITGTQGPIGSSIPTIIGSIGGATGSRNVPGNDDTYLPNPFGLGIPTPPNP